jgi:hypothetical protein
LSDCPSCGSQEATVLDANGAENGIRGWLFECIDCHWRWVSETL